MQSYTTYTVTINYNDKATNYNNKATNINYEFDNRYDNNAYELANDRFKESVVDKAEMVSLIFKDKLNYTITLISKYYSNGKLHTKETIKKTNLKNY